MKQRPVYLDSSDTHLHMDTRVTRAPVPRQRRVKFVEDEEVRLRDNGKKHLFLCSTYILQLEEMSHVQCVIHVNRHINNQNFHQFGTLKVEPPLTKQTLGSALQK